MAEEPGNEEGRTKSSPLPSNPLLSPPNYKRNPGDLPALSNCHSCGLHFPPKSHGIGENLETLESQWRIVLLCSACIARLRSAAACSYCFSSISGDDGGVLDCRLCSRRVHLRCAPLERGYVALSELRPDSFTCIDCCALPSSRRRNPSSSSTVALSLEDLVRNASSAAEKKAAAAARAKDKARRKALAARRSVELARDALDAVVVGKGSSPPPDEALALELHRVMNGSQRVLRTRRRKDLDIVGSKKARVNGDTNCVKTESCDNGICVKVEFCTEDKVFFEHAEGVMSGKNASGELDSHVKKVQQEEADSRSGLDSHAKKEHGEEVDGCSGSSLVEAQLMEIQGRFSKVVDSFRDGNGIGSTSTNRESNGLSHSSLPECGVGNQIRGALPMEQRRTSKSGLKGMMGKE